MKIRKANTTSDKEEHGGLNYNQEYSTTLAGKVLEGVLTDEMVLQKAKQI